MRTIIRKIYHLLPISLKKKVKKLYLFYINIFNFFIIKKREKDLVKNLDNKNIQGTKGLIIYLSAIDWKIETFQRPQQIFLCMSELNYLIFFMTPNKKDNIKGFQDINENLILTNIPISVFNVIKKLYGFQKILVYISLPVNVTHLKYLKLRNYLVLYDILDELEIVSRYDQEIQKQHDWLLKNADIVITTADNLYKKAKLIREDTTLCPNGCDYDHFSKTKNITIIPDDLIEVIKNENIIVGYHGALAEWIDYQLIEYIAKNLNDCEIILIGPDYDGSINKSNIIEIKNIHWLGPKPYQDLPKYLKWFDIAILPFKINKITMSTSPIKLFENMAAGIPIVSVDLPEPKKYKSVLIAKNYEEYVELIIKAKNLKNNKKYLELLDKEAKENSWSNIVKIIDEIIQNKIKQKFIINNNNE